MAGKWIGTERNRPDDRWFWLMTVWPPAKAKIWPDAKWLFIY
jgi:hypothetical protein